MIRSIPDPPMDKEDVARFRNQLEKHLRGDDEESSRSSERKIRSEANANQIISNCGGKNPLLGC